jgi:hypothetical protein
MLIALPPVHGEHGGVSEDNGSVAAGIPVDGQGPAWALHVTALFVQVEPEPPVSEEVPATPKVPAQTVSAPPLVLKLPLSAIPQVRAFKVACPLMLTPSMEELGGPSVYKQPPPVVAPLKFVATARAVSVSLLTPRILMK